MPKPRIVADIPAKAKGAHCKICPLAEQPYVPCKLVEGARLLIVGEAPGFDEVAQQEPFVGMSGKLLDAAIVQAGYKREDVSLTNAVACRPPGNREPTAEEVKRCYGRLFYEIASSGCHEILTLGRTARHALKLKGPMRGGYVEVESKHWSVTHIISTWHPAYVLRKPGEGTVFLNDVRKALEGPQVHVTQRAPEVRFMKTYEELASTLSTAPSHSLVAYDLETNQVVWFDRPHKYVDPILMMGLTWDEGMGIIIDDTLLYDDPRTKTLLETFFRNMTPGGHNVKFDNIFLRHQLGINIRAKWDTMLAHYVLDENTKHGLKLLAWDEFDIPDYEKELISEYLKNVNDEYSKIPPDKLGAYCAWDVAVTLALQKRFDARLHQEGLSEWPYEKIIMPAQEAFTRTEMKGVMIDIPYMLKCAEVYDEQLELCSQEAARLSGRPGINLGSWQQVGAVLWDQLKLPQVRKRRIKDRSTSGPAVAHLKGSHPFVDALLRYRRIAKLNTSYIKNVIEFADVNSRVHPNVLIHGTEVGRISMRDPAIQTIPRPGNPKAPDYDPYEDGAVIRAAIVAPEGKKITVTDYSQAELRVLTWYSRDPFLMDAYDNNRDIHSEVALAMYGENYTKDERVRAKMFNFSYVYGGTEYSFAEEAGLPIEIARAFVRRYDRVMPRAKEWKNEQLSKMRTEGYVQSIFGRKRRFPLITQSNLDDAKKASTHSVIAGTASDLTTLSYCKLVLEDNIPCIFPVHDSILTESDDDEAEINADRVAEVMMETATEYLGEVKWKVDTEINQRWARPPKLW